MTAKLAEALGPMASIIVPEQVALLGESLDEFPKNRLKDLCERVCEEILQDDLKSEFRHNIQEYVKSL
jgi:hypothetical protein